VIIVLNLTSSNSSQVEKLFSIEDRGQTHHFATPTCAGLHTTAAGLADPMPYISLH